MNANVALVVFLGGLLVVGGVSVATGEESPPLVDEVDVYDGLPGECHLGAQVNPERLDDGERLVFERSYGNESRTDSFLADEPPTAWGADVARGANLTVYVAGLAGEGGVEVLDRSFVTADCRLVGRAGP